ncbi:predicted protein [Sclerotinia sclerotiorum 1980 UF-70]|uniref:Uncharacterized protein n=2 Tax=Sclerotinia sclerotiorum (strain ATCC 18683 / 1980 / Ss-1) TaxID=665079 RepID=A7EBF7_SCLS1|nr:predicted protein [Sclerotinia sclerotiorum 1980 UF-70]APA08841.1 hypothetical protein sscle_04g036110 [Sclerotinia sclerotiorum 1980 UF-70]EDN99785.1 predicted protein [Sclerotinia sclerotiorum 1980 UF-70]
MKASKESRSFKIAKLSRASQYHVDHMGSIKENQPAAKRSVCYKPANHRVLKKANPSNDIPQL